jgi:hypothetical protein
MYEQDGSFPSGFSWQEAQDNLPLTMAEHSPLTATPWDRSRALTTKRVA